MDRRLGVEIDADASGLVRGVSHAESSLTRLSRAAGTYVDANGRMREANGRFASSANGASGAGGNLTSSLLKTAAAYLSVREAIGYVKQGLQIVSDFQRLNTAISAVSKDSADYARAQEFLRSTSDKYGLSIEALASSYKGLKGAAAGTALEGRTTEKIFQAISKAGAALQLSNEDVAGSLRAIEQMISKGTVSSEELRGQLGERLPGAFQIAARAMGVSTQKLGKMLEQGEVAATDLLPKLAAELEKTYGSKAQKNVETMAGGFTRATDQLKLFLAEFSEQNGIDSFFTKLSNGIANYVRELRIAQAQGGQAIVRTPEGQKYIDNFLAKSPEDQEKHLDAIKAKRAKKQAELDASVAMPYSDERNQQELSLKSQIEGLRSEYATLRREQRRAAIELEPVVVPGGGNGGNGKKGGKSKSFAEVLREQLKDLDNQIASYKAKGLEIPYMLKYKRASIQDMLGEKDPKSLDGLKIESLLPTGMPKELIAPFLGGGPRVENPFMADTWFSGTEGNGQYVNPLSALAKRIPKDLKEIKEEADKAKPQYESIMKELADSMRQANVDAGANMAEGLSQLFVNAVSGQKGIINQALRLAFDGLAQYLNQLATAKLAAASVLAISGAPTEALRQSQGAARLKAGAGIVRGLGQAATMIALKTGGAVSKPTAALIGDNADVRTNPEAVFRLDQFVEKAKYIAGVTGQSVTVHGVLRGQDIHLANARAGEAYTYWNG